MSYQKIREGHNSIRINGRLISEMCVFQSKEHNQARCCLCGHIIKHESVQEIRPTGLAGAMQRWQFCDSCYISFNAMCNSPMNNAGLEAFCRKLVDPHSSIRTPQIKVR
jgi:hypothetical protein